LLWSRWAVVVGAQVPPGKLKKSMWVQAEKNTKGIVLENKTLESLFFLPTGKEKVRAARG
jgi:hypothetical protein